MGTDANGHDSAAAVRGLELGTHGFRAVFEAAPDGIVIVDESGTIRDVNAQVEAMFGYARADLLGRPVEALVPEAARRVHEGHRARYAGHPYPRPMGEGLKLEGRRKDGSLFPVEISLSPLRTEDSLLVIATVRDVTARSRLRDFSLSTLRAAEDERLRLAQELHDDTAQQLTAMLLRLRVARSLTDPREREASLDELREAIQECAEGVRRIARGLRPPALQDVGVVVAIAAHAARISEAAPLEIEVDADRMEGSLGPDGGLVLYRLVQEALSNVVRHAGASRATVAVRREEGSILTTVEDDGAGFDPAVVLRSPGLGMIGMQERAASVGGSIVFDSQPGGGTRIFIRIPMPTQETPDE